MGLIYLATNKSNGKQYVGQTVQKLNNRINQHKNDAISGRKKCYFYNAIKKYGIDNFDWDIVVECDTMEELNKMEIYYIGYYDTYNTGYNLTLGGGGTVGRVWSEETRKKAMDSKPDISGEKHPMFGIKGKDSPRYGQKHSKKARKRMSEAQMGGKSCRAKHYIITTPDGGKIHTHGLVQYCKTNNLTVNLMYVVVRGKQTHHKGYKVRKATPEEIKLCQ